MKAFVDWLKGKNLTVKFSIHTIKAGKKEAFQALKMQLTKVIGNEIVGISLDIDMQVIEITSLFSPDQGLIREFDIAYAALLQEIEHKKNAKG
jgi:hypothetical protein